MAAPTIQRVYPADGDTGIPVGETLKVWFDIGVDEKSIKDSIVLFASESDQTSGPDSAMWIDEDTGNNPYFLSSPGFKGYVPLKFEIVYWDTTDTVTYAEVTSPVTITSEADESSNNYGALVKITIDPEFAATLAADTEYTLYINGDPDSTDSGAASRTVFDTEADAGNTGSGDLVLYGPYIDDGVGDDTLNVKITTGGNIGTADYKWWWDSDGEPAATIDRITNRRYRNVGKGVQIRFTGSSFAVDDLWTANVETLTRMTTSSSVAFTTNDGSYTAAPSSPSTPATSSAPATVLPTNADPFDVDYMDPLNASYNVDPDKRIITIVFTDDVASGTITDDSVKLWAYPVEGHYGNTWAPYELEKSLSLTDDTLTIRY
jgi:hypothetical protein